MTYALSLAGVCTCTISYLVMSVHFDEITSTTLASMKKKAVFKLHHTKLLTYDEESLKCSIFHIPTKYKLQNVI